MDDLRSHRRPLLRGPASPQPALHRCTSRLAQLTLRESLRDIETCLAAQELYHSGFSAPVRRATLARANERRDWRIQADFAQRLIEALCRRSRAGRYRLCPGLNHDRPVPVRLSLGQLPNHQGGREVAHIAGLARIHPELHARFRRKFHDVNVLDILAPEPGAIYVMDRAYLDFERLYLMHQIGAFFVTRAKKNLRAHRVYSARKDGEGGVLADQTIALDGPASRRRYPAQSVRDPASGKTLVSTAPPGLTICEYKSRWQVELFFKWIKQP